MQFNSFEFLWLFPFIFAIYYLILYRDSWMMKIPRLGNYVLIAISYGLYTKYNPACALVLLGVTVITF